MCQSLANHCSSSSFEARNGANLSFVAREEMKMIQGEWNIVKMRNPSHFGTCKRVRFKNIFIETTDIATNNIETVTLMADFIIDVSV